jgi:alpha/beta superfamily hydrolase
MSNVMTVSLALLLYGIPVACQSAQQPLQGHWTGGFWLDGRWSAVNVRFDDPGRGGTADLIFPYYGGSDNAINVALEGVQPTGDGLHFEIPVGAGRVAFDGRRTGDTIAGRYVHATAHETFGLTRRADVAVETLEHYYGAYRVSPDRVISILRGWGSARTLNYVDYKTGRVGTLWPSSETDFFSGTGLAVSFPVSLRVAFERDPAGTVTRLVWQTADELDLPAQRIEFTEERIVFRNGAIPLGGTLLLPVTTERRPVVIVTPGDYGTNRNQLRLWAHNLVSEGVGALVFDARGSGESGGAVNSSSFSDLADDVLAGVRALRMRDDVDPGRIGLFGFSNSAFTVSLAASRSSDVSFLILQSLVGVVPWKQESFRAETPASS